MMCLSNKCIQHLYRHINCTDFGDPWIFKFLLKCIWSASYYSKMILAWCFITAISENKQYSPLFIFDWLVSFLKHFEQNTERKHLTCLVLLGLNFFIFDFVKTCQNCHRVKPLVVQKSWIDKFSTCKLGMLSCSISAI